MGRAQDFLDAVDTEDAADPVATLDAPSGPPQSDAPFEPLGGDAPPATFAGMDDATQDPVQQAAQPEPAPQAATIRDWLVQEHGLAALADAEDDRAAVKRVYDYAQSLDQQRLQLANELQAVRNQMQWMAHQQQQAAQQIAQPQPAQAPEPTAPLWPKPPEWDPAWLSGLTVNPETGEKIAKPGFDPSLPQKFEARQAWERNTINELLSDPAGFAQKAGILSAAEQRQQEAINKVREELKQEFQQELRSLQDRQFGQQFAAQHGTWMFQQGLDGNAMRDPTTGQPALSQEGQRVVQTATALASQGITNPQLAMQIAYNLVSGSGSIAEQAAHELNRALSGGQAPQPGAQSPAPGVRSAVAAQQQTNQAFLNRASAAAQMTRQPSRGGAAPAGTDASLAKYADMDRFSRADAMLNDMFNNPHLFADN